MNDFDWLSLIVVFVLPALLLGLEKRIRLVEWLSAAFFSYFLGIMYTNIPGVEADHALLKQLMEVSVAFAIPLLLFSTYIKQWLRLAPKALLSWGIYMVAVFACTALAVWLFRDRLDQVHNIAGMASGVYIGGTANMAAISQALGVSEQVFVEVNLTDLILSGSYLIVLLTVMQKLLLRFLPAFQNSAEIDLAEDSVSDFSSLPFLRKLANIFIGIILAAGVVVFSLKSGQTFGGNSAEVWIVILLTVLGLLASLIKPIRELPGTYETGQYLFLVFCAASGAMIDAQALIDGVPNYLPFMAVIAYGSVLIHILFSYLFRLDADTVLVTSTAGMMGPPFIGPLAQSLKNREIVSAGMTLGSIGLASGNLLGIWIAKIIESVVGM